MHKKYLVFGTGSAAERFLNKSSLAEMELITGFIDNNPEKHGKEFLDRKIFSPDNLDEVSFDKIIIASVFFNEIKNQLLNIGIPSEKIDTYINFFPNNFSQFLYFEENKDKLKNKNFSLISNSCFGSLLYKKLGLKYNTPFAGTFVPIGNYLEILKNLEYYLSLDLKTSINCGEVVGILDDALIQFPHEKNPDVAKENWNRRLERLDFNNLFVHMGFNYHYYISPIQIYSLDDAKNVPQKNKLFINEHDYYLTNNGILDFPKDGVVDIISWLNGLC